MPLRYSKLRVSLFLLSLTWAGCSLGQDYFTPVEKQQILVPTPGLFEKSSSFTVDFSALRPTDWSFPLPVGKAEADATGLNITTTKGDAVKAMFGGRVRLSRHLPGYGRTVVVRHDNGLETVYGGTAENLVQVGQRVKAGQTIALMGADEKGVARLRFEIMVNGCLINPRTLIMERSHRLQQGTFLFTDRGNSVGVKKMEEPERVSEKEKHDAPIALDEELTAADQSIVSTKTPGLFSKSNSITINFSKFTDKDWCYPLRGSRVISPYAGRRRHSGVDIKNSSRDSVFAAFSGRVRFARTYGGYGRVIVIRHASGIETLYSHNSKNLVKAGDWVKAGQLIALTGRTGRATTEHLHFELRINGRHYNPNLIFDHTTHRLKPVRLIAYSDGRVKISQP